MGDLSLLLKENPYPGRGIVLGLSEDGGSFVTAYFIMGRSENSRNRVFAGDGAGIRTKAYDESKMSDPSLIIYSPVRCSGRYTIVTNGDQTDTVYDYLKEGKSFEEALRTRMFEPDEPNFTPRISGILQNGAYRLSILKRDDTGSCQRFFYEYDTPAAGTGHFIHTYQSDGNPLPSFAGEPRPVQIDDNMEKFSSSIWEALSLHNKVSLFARYIDLDTGEYDSIILNKN